MENANYKHLQVLIDDGEATKLDQKSNSFWNEEFEKDLEKLKRIRTLYGKNAGVAERQFRQLPIFSFPSFKEYASVKSIQASRVYNKSGLKSKNIRASSKKLSCMACHSKNVRVDGQNLICMNPECQKTTPLASIETAHNLVSKTKHVSDKLAILTGVKNPPISVLNIQPYLATWLRQLKFIREYLHSKGIAEVQRFSNEYASILYDIGSHSPVEEIKIREKIGTMYMYNSEGRLSLNLFYDTLPNEEKYAYSFKEYKLMITEFCSMLNECSRLYEPKYTNSTILDNGDEKVIEIFTAYLEEKHKIPTESETFKYNDCSYDIGNTVTYLKLTYGDPDTERIVKLLDPIFSANIEGLTISPLRMPGLMFSFIGVAQLKGGKESIVPKRYTFTENYGFLIHEIFRIRHITIDPHDKDYIIDLIVKFDDYSSKTEIGGKNSKIYSAKLHLIFNMLYFAKYRELIRYLPLKAGDTSNLISKSWTEFCTIHADFVDRFNHPREGTETKEDDNDYFDQLMSSMKWTN